MMLRKILSKDYKSLKPIIDDFVEVTISQGGNVPPDLHQKIELGLSKNIFDSFVVYDQNHRGLGCAIIQQIDNQAIYHIFHMLSSFQIAEPNKIITAEMTLFNGTFAQLKDSCDFIRIGIQEESTELTQHIISCGFQQIDRAIMNIERASSRSLVARELPTNYSIIPLKNTMKPSIAEMIFETSVASSTDALYPEFSKIEGCAKFLEQFDETKDHYIRVLRAKEEIVGVCLLIKESESAGFLSYLGISPTYQRKGLGKALITQSLLEFFKNEPDVNRVSLGVALNNMTAVNLYSSLGFVQTANFSSLIWKNLHFSSH